MKTKSQTGKSTPRVNNFKNNDFQKLKELSKQRNLTKDQARLIDEVIEHLNLERQMRLKSEE